MFPPHVPYTRGLQDTFRKQGVQIIAKTENIEFTLQDAPYPNQAFLSLILLHRAYGRQTNYVHWRRM
jgi:hypothetical protein